MIRVQSTELTMLNHLIHFAKKRSNVSQENHNQQRQLKKLKKEPPLLLKNGKKEVENKRQI